MREPTAPNESDDERERRPLRDGLASVAAAFAAVALLGDRFAHRVQRGRYAAAWLAAIVAALIATLSLYRAIDPRHEVLAEAAAEQERDIAKLEAGERIERTQTDRQVEATIEKRRSVGRVTDSLGRSISVLTTALFLTLALYALARLARAKPAWKSMLAVSTHAALPLACKHVVIAGVALAQPALTSEQASGLIANPLAPLWQAAGPVAERIAGGIDLFTIWAIVVVIVGFRVAADCSRKRATVAVLLGTLGYLLFTMGPQK